MLRTNVYQLDKYERARRRNLAIVCICTLVALGLFFSEQLLALVRGDFSSSPSSFSRETQLNAQLHYLPAELLLQPHQPPAVRMCRLSFRMYKYYPSFVPTFASIVDKHDAQATRPSDDTAEQSRECDEVSLESLVNQVEASTPDTYLQPSGFMLHQSHSGSSLLSNFFAVNPHVMMISEASAPLQFLLWCKQQQHHDACDEDMRTRYFRALLLACGGRQELHAQQQQQQHQRQQKNKYVVRFQPAMMYFIDVVRQSFPEVPFVFLYRDPEVLLQSYVAEEQGLLECVSNVGALKFPYDILQTLQMTREEADEVSQEEFCAAHLATMATHALRTLEMDCADGTRRGKVVNYSLLQRNQALDTFVNVVLPHFGWDPREGLSAYWRDALEREAPRYSKRRQADGELNIASAKWTSKGEFIDDSEERKQALKPQHKAFVDAYMQQPYQELDAFEC